MNKVVLRGIISGIKLSHKINDIEYYLANILTNDNGKESINLLKFKKFSNRFKEGDFVEIEGNVRNYSNNNKQDIYVFTYFDLPKNVEINNFVSINGRICKIDQLRKSKSGKEFIHFILANNIYTKNSKINAYIPCTAWGKLAKNISNFLIGLEIEIVGKLLSREYKKYLDNNELEIRIAHELLVLELNEI